MASNELWRWDAVDLAAAIRTRAISSREAVEAHIASEKGLRVPLLPVFAMVDRRRALHRAALAANPDWPTIPMASAFERMTEARAPIGTIAPRSSAPVQAVAALWQAVEKRLAK